MGLDLAKELDQMAAKNGFRSQGLSGDMMATRSSA